MRRKYLRSKLFNGSRKSLFLHEILRCYNDLSIAFILLLNAKSRKSNNNETKNVNLELYIIKLICTHTRETIRLISSRENLDIVHTFMSTSPKLACDFRLIENELRDPKLDDTESVMSKYLIKLRDILIHYMIKEKDINFVKTSNQRISQKCPEICIENSNNTLFVEGIELTTLFSIYEDRDALHGISELAKNTLKFLSSLICIMLEEMDTHIAIVDSKKS